MKIDYFGFSPLLIINNLHMKFGFEGNIIWGNIGIKFEFYRFFDI